MEELKEFQGKSLDEAIHNACIYYNTPREKLEIEIIEDAKSGFFGIVGARNARIKARRVSLPNNVSSLLEQDNSKSKPANLSRKPRVEVRKDEETHTTREIKSSLAKVPSVVPFVAVEKPVIKAPTPVLEKPIHVVPSAPSIEASPVAKDSIPTLRPPKLSPEATGDDTGRRVSCLRRRGPVRPSEAEDDGSEHRIPFEELDQNKLFSFANEAAKQIINSIVEDVSVSVELGDGRVTVNVECGNADISPLIGHDGQTLASVQYLISRIVSTKMESAVRVYVNVSDYHERQEERLKELALVLAERVRATGRACSTRPMSSYHRRIIHLALENASDIQTRSSGEGSLKRIIVQKKKPA